jgi:hypothetical protein
VTTIRFFERTVVMRGEGRVELAIVVHPLCNGPGAPSTPIVSMRCFILSVRH